MLLIELDYVEVREIVHRLVRYFNVVRKFLFRVGQGGVI